MTVVPNAWKVATGYTGRRLIVDNAKCNACHAALGVSPTYHSGNRNDAQTCTFCHNVNRTNSGWPVNINYDVHAIHGAAMRANKFSWEVSAGAKYWEVGYPGLLKNCEMCHVAGMYDFSVTASSSAVPNLLMTTAASGTQPAVVPSIITGTEAVPGTYYSPFVTAGAAYGVTFAYNANTSVTTPPAATTLVLSPISAACSGCHDSAAARAHMQANGGSVFDPRSTALASTEQCLVCHGTANNAAFNETVPTIKAVHRWW
jgi:OmcA/MtrC family decaheme c-type cytochrome